MTSERPPCDELLDAVEGSASDRLAPNPRSKRPSAPERTRPTGPPAWESGAGLYGQECSLTAVPRPGLTRLAAGTVRGCP